MKQIIVSIIIFLLLVGCNDRRLDFEEVSIFRNKYDFKFDIKSEKDGEILYKGRLDQDQIWWQF
jgi:hypothetical protein